VWVLLLVARFEPTLLKPRSAGVGDERKHRPTRPSMLMRRSPSLIAIAIPTVLTAAAVYIALFFATRMTGTLLKLDQPGNPEIRPIDTSEKPPPFIEQAPPPSPEVVAERVRREIEASQGGRGGAPFPVLELEMEPAAPTLDILPLEPLNIPPRNVLTPLDLRPNGTAPSIPTEAR
jgi:hypothetical protein